MHSRIATQLGSYLLELLRYGCLQLSCPQLNTIETVRGRVDLNEETSKRFESISC
jgi:hypothetical protein